MAIEFFRSFLQQANATGTRSTALTDLRWFAALVLSALLISIKFNAPAWILYSLFVLLGIVSLVYLAAYIFFAICDRDALRSEKFTLSKMAIEKSITGDNLSGLIDPENPPKSEKLLPSKTKKEEL
jgi:hypothetical protein